MSKFDIAYFLGNATFFLLECLTTFILLVLIFLIKVSSIFIKSLLATVRQGESGILTVARKPLSGGHKLTF